MNTITTTDGTWDDLGLPVFDDTANAIYLLPLGVADGKFLFSTNTSAVLKLLNEQEVSSIQPAFDGETLYRDERSFTWLGPTLLITAASLVDNPNLLNVALGVIANYVTDLFKGRSSSESMVKLDIVVKDSPRRNYRRITYHGPPDGLLDAAKVVDAGTREP